MASTKKKDTGGVWARLLFAVYVAAMLWLLFGQRLDTVVYQQGLADSINLQPFATVMMYWKLLRDGGSAYYVRHAFINLLGNVVMFVPLGYFLPSLFGRLRSFFKTVLFALCIIVTVETVQYFTMLGTCDIDDLILNLAGVAVGYPIWRLCRP